MMAPHAAALASAAAGQAHRGRLFRKYLLLIMSLLRLLRLPLYLYRAPRCRKRSASSIALLLHFVDNSNQVSCVASSSAGHMLRIGIGKRSSSCFASFR